MTDYNFPEVQAPISSKIILASWIMSGSNFTKNLVRENFPEYADPYIWAKTHTMLHTRSLQKLRNCKVLFVIADPRDAAAHIAFRDGGRYLSRLDFSSNSLRTLNSVSFLNENIRKVNEMISFYKSVYDNDCIFVKYEDAYLNTEKFLLQMKNFFKLNSLDIDDIAKYKHSIHRDIGIFDFYFDSKVLNDHYKINKAFYDKWEYPKAGYKERYALNNEGGMPFDDYFDILRRNGIKITDDIKKRFGTAISKKF